MTLENLYEEIGGDYQTMVACFADDRRIEKYLFMFPQDDSYSLFIDSMEKKDIKTAFRAIHTLKGVCINLGLTGLYKVSDIITEGLRREDAELAEKYLPELTDIYKKHIDAIKRYRDL